MHVTMVPSQSRDPGSAKMLEKVGGTAVTITIYAVAWYIYFEHGSMYLTSLLVYRIFPVVVVMVSFAGVVKSSPHYIGNINSCSCWCLPVYGNVLPYALPRDEVRFKGGSLPIY